MMAKAMASVTAVKAISAAVGVVSGISGVVVGDGDGEMIAVVAL